MDEPIHIQENKFKEYLLTAYSNENTRKQYGDYERKFLEVINQEVLDQNTINTFIIWVRKKKPNNFYTGFLKAYINCYDPEGIFPIKIPKDKSRKPKSNKKPYHLSEDQINVLINKCSKQVRLMVRLYYETGLRVTELLNVKRSKIDLKTRHLKGIGKGNKVFEVHFSKKTAYLLSKWLEYRKDDYPFRIVNKSIGEYYKQQRKVFSYHLRKQSKILIGVSVNPHLIRHALGYNLRAERGWDLEQVRAKLRHCNLSTTQIYSRATAEEIEEKEDLEIFEEA